VVPAAYFDDGTPLGSATNDECRIDSIAQSWGVISGAAEPARGARAMTAVEKYLVRRSDALVLLFTSPFDHASPDPGYIKGYLPGVRENCGQYTHGAIWSVLAFAALGDGDKAGELFAILNPINHASSRAAVYRYKVEPYVIAAEIYSEPPHTGCGGWTWHTGSAGWLYRGGIEWILGFCPRGTALHLDPCIPRTWPGFKIIFRYHWSRYEIVVENPHGVSRGGCRPSSSMAHGSRVAASISNSRMTAQPTMCALSLARKPGILQAEVLCDDDIKQPLTQNALQEHSQ
jgi:cyclic beta-1,2-glucan synthetase